MKSKKRIIALNLALILLLSITSLSALADLLVTKAELTTTDDDIIATVPLYDVSEHTFTTDVNEDGWYLISASAVINEGDYIDTQNSVRFATSGNLIMYNSNVQLPGDYYSTRATNTFTFNALVNVNASTEYDINLYPLVLNPNLPQSVDTEKTAGFTFTVTPQTPTPLLLRETKSVTGSNDSYFCFEIVTEGWYTVTATSAYARAGGYSGVLGESYYFMPGTYSLVCRTHGGGSGTVSVAAGSPASATWDGQSSQFAPDSILSFTPTVSGDYKLTLSGGGVQYYATVYDSKGQQLGSVWSERILTVNGLTAGSTYYIQTWNYNSEGTPSPITMEFVRVVAPYVPDNTSSGTGSTSSGTASGNTTNGTEITVKTTVVSGETVAAVTNDDFKAVIGAASDDTKPTVVVKVKSDTDKASVNIDRRALDSLATDTDADMKLDFGYVSVTFDNDALNTISVAAGGDISITVDKLDASKLNLDAENLAKIGDRPVYDFTVKSNNTEISDFNGGTAFISIPYTLRPGENPNAVVIYYIADNGELQSISCRYNSETNTIDFVLTHFSKYAVAYNLVEFTDVPSTASHYNAVTYLAARGVVEGYDGRYMPDEDLTRAQLLAIMMRAYGFEPDSDLRDNFNDAGDAWYAGHLAAAKRLGLSQGVGGNMFDPERLVTAQEVYQFMYNILLRTDGVPSAAAGAVRFELTGTAEWAQTAVTRLIEAGVTLDVSQFDATESVNRSEMAILAYRLLNR